MKMIITQHRGMDPTQSNAGPDGQRWSFVGHGMVEAKYSDLKSCSYYDNAGSKKKKDKRGAKDKFSNNQIPVVIRAIQHFLLSVHFCNNGSNIRVPHYQHKLKNSIFEMK